jgi:hypothetical protein
MVTQAQEIATTVEDAHAILMLATEASVREAIAAWDSATLRVKDAEDRAALVKRESLERVWRVEIENTTVLASAREDAEGLAQKITLLEDELAVECRAQEVWKREHREQFEELTLPQTRGSELCHAIVSLPWMRHHLTEAMRLAALRHTEIVGELATHRAAVSTVMESVLGHSPSETFCVEVVSELAIEFQKMEYRCSQLERPVVRIYDLFLGPPPSRAQLADCLDKAAG